MNNSQHVVAPTSCLCVDSPKLGGWKADECSGKEGREPPEQDDGAQNPESESKASNIKDSMEQDEQRDLAQHQDRPLEQSACVHHLTYPDR